MSEERAGFRVTGVVQGVGFRWWTQRRGIELGLRGALANRSDGSVERHVAGAPDVVAAFGRVLLRGPSGARVQSVEPVASVLPIPEAGFNIER